MSPKKSPKSSDSESESEKSEDSNSSKVSESESRTPGKKIGDLFCEPEILGAPAGRETLGANLRDERHPALLTDELCFDAWSNPWITQVEGSLRASLQRPRGASARALGVRLHAQLAQRQASEHVPAILHRELAELAATFLHNRFQERH